MNIRDLKYLVAVADLGHFGRAAEACFVSQPTLSMQLKKLEQELDVLLFERSNKQVMVTDIGRRVVAQARKVLFDVEGMKDIAASAQDPMAGVLRLGVIPTLAPYLLPHVMQHLSTSFPKLSLFLVEEKTHVLTEQLSKGLIDAAIMAVPIELSFSQRNIFDEPFYLACSVSNPLSCQDSVEMDDLSKHSIMLLEEGHCLRSQAMDICHKLTSNKLSDFSATSLETLRLMVAAGNGVTLLPALSVIDRESKGLCVKPFSDGVPTRTIAMFWRAGSHKQHCVDNVASLIESIIKPLLSRPLSV